MSTIVGRKEEIAELMNIYHRDQAQLVAVYGRRRVGKTYLVRELFKDDFAFYHTGLSPLDLVEDHLMQAQLSAFHSSLRRYGDENPSSPKSWMEAFDRLADLLLILPSNRRLVVFLDEIPWMDTPRAGFLTAFEHFWNGWGAVQHNLMLIVCGSATTWIQDRIVNSYGGLYDRVNAEIQLAPFTLREAEELLRTQHVLLSRYDILQLYMAVGGIPMYLNYVMPGFSLAQLIDMLYFSKKAKLREEFRRLFSSVFKSPEQYEQIVRALSKRHAGYTRDELSKMTGIPSGKGLTIVLKTLEASDFIECYRPYGMSKRELHYRLIDPFCIFFLQQVEDRQRGENFWQDNENRPTLNNWRGQAFENACLRHVRQIKGALGIGGVNSNNSSWTMRGVGDDHGMQIDLILDRADRVVSLCEMKYVNAEFEVKKDYENILRHRLNWMVERLDRRKNVQLTLVTTYGLKYGIHSGVFQRVVTLDSLFE